MLEGGEYLEKNTADIWAHVTTAVGVKDLSHHFARSRKENGKSQNLIAS
jgi:hypothetical protein